MVDLLLLPFFCLLEWICRTWIYFKLTLWWMLKITVWLVIVPLWDIIALIFHIVAWIVCTIFKWRTPHLKIGKRLVIYSKW